MKEVKDYKIEADVCIERDWNDGMKEQPCAWIHSGMQTRSKWFLDFEKKEKDLQEKGFVSPPEK